MADERLQRPHPRDPPEVYDARWLARIKARCVMNARGCWEWQGFKDPKWGYGHATYRGRGINAHRLVYEVVNGVRLTRQQYVCHTCDVRHCINPAHLWLGTNSENQLDSSRKMLHYESRRQCCERGHEFTEENTRHRLIRGRTWIRQCKACERVRYRLSLGWSEHEAMTLPRIPNGYRRSGQRSAAR